MAEGVLFSIAEEIIKTLGSLTAQEVALWWGLKDQLRKLNDTLLEAVYDAGDMLGDFSAQVLRNQLMSGNRVWREKLDDIDADSKRFHLEVRDEDRASLITVREQNTSSELEVIVGREGDKVIVKSFLLNSNNDENVSVISILSLKGWWKRWSRDEMNDDSDESTIEEGLRMLCFPRLSSLRIGQCPNLTSMPLFPPIDEVLFLNTTSSMPLQQTMKMTSPVSSTSSITRPLSKLKRLYIYSIDDMESVPEVGMQNLSSLQQLSMEGTKYRLRCF
ncbi:hypothetical protein POTOM_024388 [Populus tomentosa]|uniref:Rx N-terminal domain-containing protein n=1 Tax=Populus tomentosa TaxID=118781 RepID=A0A8X7ZKB1_POPTO|nr:hypothetical protein POTOM_024388 [Populus tomentosa]